MYVIILMEKPKKAFESLSNFDKNVRESSKDMFVDDHLLQSVSILKFRDNQKRVSTC